MMCLKFTLSPKARNVGMLLQVKSPSVVHFRPQVPENHKCLIVEAGPVVSGRGPAPWTDLLSISEPVFKAIVNLLL